MTADRALAADVDCLNRHDLVARVAGVRCRARAALGRRSEVVPS